MFCASGHGHTGLRGHHAVSTRRGFGPGQCRGLGTQELGGRLVLLWRGLGRWEVLTLVCLAVGESGKGTENCTEKVNVA